jgi:microcystin degradation protein MlrC
LPTGDAAFHNDRFHRTGGSLAEPVWANIPLIEWRRLAEAAGIEVVESLCANAQPAGLTVRATYEALRAAILADLSAAGGLDMVLLNLHGAMVADGYDDCEADLVRNVRAIVGPDCLIGVELDLHCHLDDRLLSTADLIVLYKNGPT